MQTADIVVVGAGLAGLTAARRLQQQGRRVVVLEARDRVGGRILNHTFADGTIVELGGQWVGPTQDRVLALAEELGLGTFPSYEAGDHILSVDGEARRWQDETFGLDEKALIDVAETQAALETLAATVPLDAPWDAPDARDLDAQTLESWLAAHMRTEHGLSFWRMLVPALFSAETDQMSLLHFLFYIRSGGMIDMLVATGGGAQDSRVTGGSQTIASRMAEQLGDAVRLGCPVHLIRQDAGGVEVVHEHGGVRAERVIVAVPPALAGRIRYLPALPARRDHLTQQVPMGCVIKMQVRYDAPFWREDGLSGFVLSLDDPVGVMFDNSPEDLRSGVLLGFLEGEHATAASLMEAGDRRELVLGCFAKHVGERALAPIEYVEQDWTAEEWSRGCYGGRMGTGVWTRYAQALREPVGRIHWAGAETSAVWNGYMDGAVRSGEQAAQEALAALGETTAAG
ncbi:flavin monoamine oxidase family protein [Capillimicrobium parvum]|uniref:L-amino acid dehydrogenase n=1 Tax=Capillimicrobium parvum TaxID=2884022 RepID=A0A9E6Y504_9ACTN|nr:flavin monoamine oxidase family protein [Capillimicrobium parvum]UGS38932.1 L-amino acid dehydrogenase [Capillimicrobium parvum]